jgi:hypothetical protein
LVASGRFGNPLSHCLRDFVTNATEDGELVSFVAGRGGGIIERHERARECPRPYSGAGLVRIVADDEDVSHRFLAQKLFDVFGPLFADIDSDFIHHAHGERMHFGLWLCSGTGDCEMAAFALPQKRFGHLTAGGVAGA